MNQSLHTLLAHAERQRDEAQARLGQAEQQLARQQQQAEQLLAYRDEYRSRSPAQGGAAVAMQTLQVHSTFMQRLEQALAQQQAQVQAAEQRCARAREALLPLELRVASVRKLLQRRQEQQRGVEARLDQRRCDEAAQQALWRNAAAGQAALS